MPDGKKQYWNEGEKERDIARFRDALKGFHEQLERIEENCLDDDILRDAVTVAVKGYTQQLEAIERACKRSRKEGGA